MMILREPDNSVSIQLSTLGMVASGFSFTRDKVMIQVDPDPAIGKVAVVYQCPDVNEPVGKLGSMSCVIDVPENYAGEKAVLMRAAGVLRIDIPARV